MLIKSSKYVASYVDVEKCPEQEIPEFAFVGRSNVGKSSLINLLVDSKALVKTSVTPGKTQTINYFLINDSFYFVDLPGYGFAKVSRKERVNWRRMIENYLTKRKQLLCVFVLVDSRHEPQQLDMEFINKLGEWSVSFVLVFTKADKTSRMEIMRTMKLMENEMKKKWEMLPPFFRSSAETREGKPELLGYIENLLEEKER